MPTDHIFISHSHEDHPLARLLVHLLIAGVGINASHIFCTSKPGLGIGIGRNWRGKIRSELEGADVAIALITPSFYKSTFCMCELGAMWALDKTFLPILVPPITVADMKAVENGIQAAHISTSADLDQFRDELLTRLEHNGLPTAHWNAEKQAFLKELPKLFRQQTKERQEGTYLLDNCALPAATALNSWLLDSLGETDHAPWLLAFDIDRLNQINAAHGVEIGSQILYSVHAVLERHATSFVLHGQCGDDTFFALLIGNKEYVNARGLALLEDIRTIPSTIATNNLWVTASAAHAKYIANQSIFDWKSRLAAALDQCRRLGGNEIIEARDDPPATYTSWS